MDVILEFLLFGNGWSNEIELKCPTKIEQNSLGHADYGEFSIIEF